MKLVLSYLILFISCSNLFATPFFRVSDALYPSPKDRFSYEINKIIFEGGSDFTDKDLMVVIGSRPSKRGLVHDIYKMYFDEGTKNPITPKTLLNIVEKNMNELDYEIRYFSSETAQSDALSLQNFYNNMGWHDAEVGYTFYPDSTLEGNVLTFTINSGKRHTVKSIVYVGLEELAPSLIPAVERFKQIQAGDYFNEEKVLREVLEIKNYLDNNGYFFNKVSTPIVIIDPITNADSITVIFDLGRRIRFGKTKFTDVRKDQAVIVDNLKRAMLEYNEGEWYSRDKVIRSNNNLLSLLVFELVAFDTLTRLDDPEKLDWDITLHYRKQQDRSIGLAVNQKQAEQIITNVGVELDYTHRNALNAAQNFHPFINGFIRDISRSITEFSRNGFSGLELEGQGGLTYNQPLLATIGAARVGGAANLIFSSRRIDNFTLQTTSLLLRTPIRLPPWVYLNTIPLDLSFERQTVDNFSQSLPSNFNELPLDQQQRILQSLALYSDLTEFTDKTNIVTPTNLMLSIGIQRDTRNNPFSPTRGILFQPNFDFNIPSLGLANFLRFQLNWLGFYSTDELSTYAFKFKAGHIMFYDDENTYMPVERQFFAGGANSIRGWDARRLRYTQNIETGDIPDNLIRFLQDFVGNRTLIELTGEYRQKFPASDYLDESLNDHLTNTSLVGFIDIGNAFNWIAFDQDAKNIAIKDYITGMALSVGAGLRYDTPFGPFRIDFAMPIYGPFANQYSTIWKTGNYWNNLAFHIGLGQAF